MGCERIEELLSPYLEDELTQEDRQTVETHLYTCASCAELLSLMREARESLSSFPEVYVSEGYCTAYHPPRPPRQDPHNPW